MIQTGDGGFLLCGYCWFPEDTTNPQGLAWLQHVLVKTDSAGNEKWVIPDTLNMELGGVLISVIEHNNFFYVSGYTREVEAIWHPYLGKYNQEGQLVDSHILHSDTLFSILFGLQENNDTLYHSSQCFYGSYDPTFTGVFSTDTSGTLFKHLQNKTGSPRHNAFVQTLDYKYLIGGYAPYDYEEFDELDAWAMKVNSNLEYDTLYSFPFVYDSLCPFPIPTDTIDCDCDLITGFGKPVAEANRYKLSLFPNPSNQIVTVRFQDISGPDPTPGLLLTLYDLFGKKVLEHPILKDTQINVTGLPPGIYILSVSQQGTVLAREKLIVM